MTTKKAKTLMLRKRSRQNVSSPRNFGRECNLVCMMPSRSCIVAMIPLDSHTTIRGRRRSRSFINVVIVIDRRIVNTIGSWCLLARECNQHRSRVMPNDGGEFI